MNRRVTPDVARWIASVVLTTVVAVLMIPLGIFAGATGFAPLALLVVAAIAALALRAWRRAVLALSVVALALAGGVALGGQSSRVAGSAGTLYAAPASAQGLDGAAFRRGVGGVVLDLRGVALRPGTTTRVALRADSSRVVVALRRNTCVAVRLRVQPLEPNAALNELANWTRSAGLGSLGMQEGVSGPWFAQDLLATDHPDDARRLSQLGVISRDFSGFVGAPGLAFGNSQLFGRAPSRVYRDSPHSGRSNASQLAPYRMERGVRAPGASVLELNVHAAGPVVVRDYPAGRSVERLADAMSDPLAWPYEQPMPTNPEMLDARAAWPPRWLAPATRDPLRQRWAAWERDAVREAQQLARRQAGSCATTEALRNQWQVERYGGQAAAADGEASDFPERVIAVNGLGELMVGPSGAQLANESPQELARLTGTRLISGADVRARELAYARWNLVDAR
jgi:hypothetical protein